MSCRLFWYSIDWFEYEEVNSFWFRLLKSEYFLVSLLLYGSKLNIFGLWTKQDIQVFGNRFWRSCEQIRVQHVHEEDSSKIQNLLCPCGCGWICLACILIYRVNTALPRSSHFLAVLMFPKSTLNCVDIQNITSEIFMGVVLDAKTKLRRVLSEVFYVINSTCLWKPEPPI